MAYRPVSKADYKTISETYDVGRRLSDHTIEFWTKNISDKIGSRRDILSLGCGTGRFEIPLARCGYKITGVDSSEEMLAKARKKKDSELVTWERQDSTSLTYPNESFDAVFMSHLLHHIDDPPGLITKCYDILKTGGIILNRYGAIEDIVDDPEHRFFPEAVEIDVARTPTKKLVEEWFKAADFKDVSSETTNQITFESPEDRLERIRLKFTSVLSLISRKSFQDGIELFEDYMHKNPDNLWLLTDIITLTVGYKR